MDICTCICIVTTSTRRRLCWAGQPREPQRVHHQAGAPEVPSLRTFCPAPCPVPSSPPRIHAHTRTYNPVQRIAAVQRSNAVGCSLRSSCSSSRHQSQRLCASMTDRTTDQTNERTNKQNRGRAHWAHPENKRANHALDARTGGVPQTKQTFRGRSLCRLRTVQAAMSLSLAAIAAPRMQLLVPLTQHSYP